MTRAVVFLTATLLFASLGAVAQNNSTPSGGQSASVQASAPAQNATQPAAPPPSAPIASTPPGTTTNPQSKSIQASTQSADPRTTSSAELPQTSTILPLLGLLGLGSLVAGLFARR
jgi:hypothetical protein